VFYQEFSVSKKARSERTAVISRVKNIAMQYHHFAVSLLTVRARMFSGLF
jgi:hypothetical protein